MLPFFSCFPWPIIEFHCRGEKFVRGVRRRFCVVYWDFLDLTSHQQIHKDMNIAVRLCMCVHLYVYVDSYNCFQCCVLWPEPSQFTENSGFQPLGRHHMRAHHFGASMPYLSFKKDSNTPLYRLCVPTLTLYSCFYYNKYFCNFTQFVEIAF